MNAALPVWQALQVTDCTFSLWILGLLNKITSKTYLITNYLIQNWNF